MDFRFLHAIFAALQPCQSQQPPDQFVQPIGLELDPFQRPLGFRPGPTPRQPQRHIQTRQRRPQFMRHIVEQVRLRVDQIFQPFRHRIKIAHQFG